VGRANPEPIYLDLSRRIRNTNWSNAMKSKRPISVFVMAGAAAGLLAWLAGGSALLTPLAGYAATETKQGASMPKPFVFREASLPKGFPPPGPVGRVIIKDYPAYRLARVKSGVNGASGDSDSMFRPLFNHIKRNDIPMTAPVELGYRADGSEPAGLKPKAGDARSAESMAFLYRDPSWGKVGSDQADARVVVDDMPATTVLSVGVRGSYNDANMVAGLKKINEWMAANPGRVQVVGPARYLGYNSPFVPWFMRYGEVQVPVTPVGQSAQSVGR
jgi:hypothetical protein